MRVLVVEDEKEIRNFIKKTFEEECFTVDAVENGEQALEAIADNKYDLVTMDYSMPKMNGLEALKKMRSKETHIPVLVLSVRSETTTKVDLLNAGADDYLTKPFSVDEFLARARALLRRPKNIKSEILKIDDLELDMCKHTVKRAGEAIYLTRKEFALLDYFMRNHEVVLTRSMIMEHVWDMSADPFSNTIESHVMSLRKKIDKDDKNKLFHTVVGRGYKLSIAE